MSIHRLPIFLCAAEYLNFTKAAEKLHISQTAVSQHIKQLEQELGFQLFTRDRRGAVLTPAGAEYYQQCKKLMAQYNMAVASGKKIAEHQVNKLTIGYAGAYELWNAARLVRQYTDTYQEPQIDFHFATNEVLLDDVTSGKIDVAIICDFGVELDDWLAAKELSNEPCVLMLSEKHQLASKKELRISDLANLPIALNRAQDSHSTASQILQMYSHLGMSGSRRYYIDDLYSLAMLVSAGIAVSVVPETMKRMGFEGLSFIPIRGFHEKTRIVMVYPKRNPAPVVQQLLPLL